MPDTDGDQAQCCVERVRRLVAARAFRYQDRSYPVTVSIGVASFSGEDWMTSRELISHADAKLLQAKQKGRNRVEA
jgi:diguanylate cyclase (GGDEF)-like protein